ncbi:coniferyl-alcohol dehydrogenase [Brucella pituitosa]|uniref:NAD(P)-dependent dehydrogenase (Short-subunit alcohol dehydrogenase family) n=2 Tax=Hyphomicrobiales TaxID=356 RepID=A0A285V779_9HYPH|nr:coniferyl-alcohol dehydrogenase [Brucella pituitosa]SOC48381.1 NAD(P)-dependent dehydrogenase (short-subunit alcohol dehydrogenase family) [Rhizobium subbaraonis]
MMLTGKTIVVTGVSSGIGAETARTIKRQGGTVIGVDRNPAGEAVDSFFQADLSSRDSIDALVASLPHGIDGLANIAGVPPTAPPEVVVAVNVVGLKYLTEKLVSKMSENGAIVSIASLAGVGWADSVPQIRAAEGLEFDQIPDFCREHDIDEQRSYFFSKEAVIVWTLQNRWTWRDRGIRINAVSPGPVETPILADFVKTLGARVEEDMRVMDRPGRPSDIAPVVAFLLSDGSRWIRGVNIPADGGMNSYILSHKHNL